jgi:PAS domain S-box-containing protein
MGKQSSPEYLKQRIKDLEQEVKKAKARAEAQQATEVQLEELVKNAVAGIYQTTEKGKLLLVNLKLAQIFGFDSPEAFLAAVNNVSQLYANPEDRDTFLRRMKSKGFIEGFEASFNRPDGKVLWCSISSRAIHRKTSETIYEGFIFDITERKLALNSLYESEKRFRTLVEQAAESFFIHDYDGKIIDVNQHACLSLGYSRDELLKKTIADIDVYPRPDKEEKTKFWKTLLPGKAVTFESRHLRCDGVTFPVEVRLGRLDIGEKHLLLSLCRDVTERNRKKEELEKAFEEIKQLKNQLEEENIHLREEIELKFRHELIVGDSDVITQVLSIAEKVAPQDTCVLILGETGTGKELLARAIHNISPRKGRPMVPVNCAALPASLIESELFGREKGAFTGAVTRRLGRFDAANESTIFLDEIGDLPIELQAKLLRVLQEGQFERLGSNETINVNVRIIAATNHDLGKLVSQGKFRKDLYYRLNVFPITLPPLRERQEDIPLLVWAFVKEFCQSMGKRISTISSITMDLLAQHPWPGNVRELKNVIERAMIMSDGSTLHLDFMGSQNVGVGLNLTLDEVDRAHIQRVLEHADWRVSGEKGAAKILGLKPTTLEARMRKLGIQRPTRHRD